METVEIVVYLAIAIIVGALIITVITSWDAQGTYKGMRALFAKKGVESEILVADFPKTVLAVWEECGLGEGAVNKTIYVRDAGDLTKEALFGNVSAAGLCKTLQSMDDDCGGGDDVIFNEPNSFEAITTPAVVVLQCESRKLSILT